MPHPFWRHMCRDRESQNGAAVCDHCGTVGVFGGWRLGVIEMMGNYQLKYRLRPIGPHRLLADKLFENTRRECDLCEGQGVLGPDEFTWGNCPACYGTGGFWTISQEEFDVRRQRVIAAHPEAAVNDYLCAVGEELFRFFVDGTSVLVTRENGPHSSSTRVRLPQTDVVRAFAQARRRLGAHWPLKGRGHCRRVTLRSHLSGSAAEGAPDCWQRVKPHGSWRRRLFAFPIVECAASLLGIPVDQVVSQEF